MNHWGNDVEWWVVSRQKLNEKKDDWNEADELQQDIELRVIGMRLTNCSRTLRVIGMRLMNCSRTLRVIGMRLTNCSRTLSLETQWKGWFSTFDEEAVGGRATVKSECSVRCYFCNGFSVWVSVLLIFRKQRMHGMDAAYCIRCHM